MFTKVNSVGIRGIDGVLVGVEADAGDGLPSFAMVGYLASEVKEAQDRVRTALKNSGFSPRARKVTVNLSPQISARLVRPMICPSPWRCWGLMA